MIAIVDTKSIIKSLKSKKLVEYKRRRIHIAAVIGSLKTAVTERKCARKKQLANSMTKHVASGLELLDLV